MNYLIWLPTAYITAFLMLTVIKNLHSSTEKLIFCTTCISYFTVMILAFFLAFDPVILSYMIGMSVTGIAIKLKDKVRNEFASQLLFTMIGLTLLTLIFL